MAVNDSFIQIEIINRKRQACKVGQNSSHCGTLLPKSQKTCSDRFGKNGYRKPSGNCEIPLSAGYPRLNGPPETLVQSPPSRPPEREKGEEEPIAQL